MVTSLYYVWVNMTILNEILVDFRLLLHVIELFRLHHCQLYYCYGLGVGLGLVRYNSTGV